MATLLAGILVSAGSGVRVASAATQIANVGIYPGHKLTLSLNVPFAPGEDQLVRGLLKRGFQPQRVYNFETGNGDSSWVLAEVTPSTTSYTSATFTLDAADVADPGTCGDVIVSYNVAVVFPDGVFRSTRNLPAADAIHWCILRPTITVTPANPGGALHSNPTQGPASQCGFNPLSSKIVVSGSGLLPDTAYILVIGPNLFPSASLDAPGYRDLMAGTLASFVNTDADGNISTQTMGDIAGEAAGSWTVKAVATPTNLGVYAPLTSVQLTSSVCVVNGAENASGQFRIDAYGVGFMANTTASLQLDYGELPPQDAPPQGNPIIYNGSVDNHGNFYLSTGANCWPPGDQIKESIEGWRPDKSPVRSLYLVGYTGYCAFIDTKPPPDIGG